MQLRDEKEDNMYTDKQGQQDKSLVIKNRKKVNKKKNKKVAKIKKQLVSLLFFATQCTEKKE